METDEQFDVESKNHRLGVAVDPARLLRVLWGARRLIGLTAVLGALLGAAIAKWYVNPEYEASTLLQWEPDVGDDQRVAPHPRELYTMVEGVTLHSNLASIAKRLGGNQEPEAIGRALEVDVEGGSSVITILARAASAERAADLANTTVSVFAEHRKRMLSSRNTDLTKSLGRDVAATKAKFAEAQRTYDAFRAELGVTDLLHAIETTTKELTVAEAEVGELAAEIDALEETERMYRKDKRHQRKRMALSTSVSNPLQAELAAAEAKLSADEARLAPDHPSILRQRAHVASLRSKAAEMSETVSAGTFGLNPEHVAVVAGLRDASVKRRQAQVRLQAARELAKAKRARLTELEAVQGRGSVLLTQVGVAQEHLIQLTGRLSEAADAMRSDFPGFRVLSKAEPPRYPGSSRRKVVVFGVALGLVLFVCLGLLLRDLWGLRVRTAREAAYWGRASVVATSPWPHDSRALACLVGDLVDGAAHARGVTLVVGASRAEEPLAHKVAALVSRCAHQTRSSARDPLDSMATSGPLMLPSGNEGDASAEGPEELGEARPDGDPRGLPVVCAWDGPPAGQALRRAARMADRVLVLVSSGGRSMVELARLRERLGRDKGVGMLVVGVDDAAAELPDRIGDVDSFWRALRNTA